jgi:hypothetical protein
MDITNEMFHERIQKLRLDLTSKAGALSTARKRVAELEGWVRSTAVILDPDCPDVGAYVDGHCALARSVQEVLDRAEKLERERDELRCRLHHYTDAAKVSLKHTDICPDCSHPGQCESCWYVTYAATCGARDEAIKERDIARAAEDAWSDDYQKLAAKFAVSERDLRRATCETREWRSSARWEGSADELVMMRGMREMYTKNRRMRREAECDRDELQEKYTRCYLELVSTARRASLAERDLIDAQRERDDARGEVERLKEKV